MVLDAPTLVGLLRNRVLGDNALSNHDSEYVSDVDECMTLYVNPETYQTAYLTGLTYSGATPPALTAGSIFMDPQLTPVPPLFFALTIVRAELHIIDRKLELEVPMAILSDTPAGKFRGKDVPKLRDDLRRHKVADLYEELKETFLWGAPSGRTIAPDMRDVLRYRNIPNDKFSLF